MTPACIGGPAFVYVQLCSHPACIGGPAFIRSRHLIEEIRYILTLLYTIKVEPVTPDLETGHTCIKWTLGRGHQMIYH